MRFVVNPSATVSLSHPSLKTAVRQVLPKYNWPRLWAGGLHGPVRENQRGQVKRMQLVVDEIFPMANYRLRRVVKIRTSKLD